MWYIIFQFFTFLVEGKGGKMERNINMCLLFKHPLLGTWSHNPGMCPDWESNWRPFGSQAGAQSTEPHQPGLIFNFNLLIYLKQVSCTQYIAGFF